MVHDHLSHLKLDRRLLRRRDWQTQAELDKQLAALPDVAEKAKSPEEEAAEASADEAPAKG